MLLIGTSERDKTSGSMFASKKTPLKSNFMELNYIFNVYEEKEIFQKSENILSSHMYLQI